MQLTKEEVLHLYYEMRKIRRFEETVKKKSGTDIVGPTHLYIGQEFHPLPSRLLINNLCCS